MKILVTGGAGYIGSHTCLELISAGHQVVIADNLSNAKEEAVRRIRRLSGTEIPFHKIDLCDLPATSKLFQSENFGAIIHFAGYKAVGESVEKPLMYYQNNLVSTLNLLTCMKHFGVNKLVFSSSATVYGDPATVPIQEHFSLSATNPYGRTKLMIEEILRDFCIAEPQMEVALLRYFNPVGAHHSGQIGEDPNGIPNNLMPFIAQVAVGKREKLRVFGNDYPTVDGTGVRDYIHVVDLAKGHVKAIEALHEQHGCMAYNLGTGRGSSVLEVLKAFEKACGKSLAYEITARRPGDVASCYADPAYAEKALNWKAEKTLNEMCADSWRWQSMNPNGFDD